MDNTRVHSNLEVIDDERGGEKDLPMGQPKEWLGLKLILCIRSGEASAGKLCLPEVMST